MTRTYENWPPEYNERLTRDCFFNSIEDQNLKISLWTKTPKTVEEAALWADILEEMKGTSNHCRNFTTSTHTYEDFSKYDQQEQKRKKRNAQNQYERKNQPNYQNRSNWRRNKPYNSRGTSNYRPPPTAYSNHGRGYHHLKQSSRGNSHEAICFHCKEPGHLQKYCPTNAHRFRNNHFAGHEDANRRYGSQSEN